MGRDIWCVLDPAAPDRLPLECAVRLARIFTLDALRERPVEVDVAAVDQALDGIRTQVSTVQGMQASLTSITTAAGAGPSRQSARSALITASHRDPFDSAPPSVGSNGRSGKTRSACPVTRAASASGRAAVGATTAT